jgi:hypothetical protein
MPLARSLKPSSTDRRHRLASRIDQLGFPAMAPCPQCIDSNSICVVQKSSTRCSCCIRKNIACGGTFSDAEFDALEVQKRNLFLKKMEARSRLRSLAFELLAVQKETEQLDKALDKVHARQEKMIDQEARALSELDTFTGSPSGDPLAFMSDLDFSVDPSFVLVPEVPESRPPSGGSPLYPPVKGVPLVSTCFLNTDTLSSKLGNSLYYL